MLYLIRDFRNIYKGSTDGDADWVHRNTHRISMYCYSHDVRIVCVDVNSGFIEWARNVVLNNSI